MARGREPVDTELAGLLYREKFGLSWKELQNEPADQVGLWLALERIRAEAAEEERRKAQIRR